MLGILFHRAGTCCNPPAGPAGFTLTLQYKNRARADALARPEIFNLDALPPEWSMERYCTISEIKLSFTFVLHFLPLGSIHSVNQHSVSSLNK